MKNINETIRDRTIRHMIYMEQLKTREVKEILKTLDKEILPDLIEKLQIRLSKIEDFGFDRGQATTRRIEALIKSLSDISKEYKNINNRVQGELFELGVSENKWQIGMIKEETGVDLDFIVPNEKLIKSVITSKPFDGRTLEQWFDRLANSTQERLGQEIRRGVVEGLTTDQIVRNVRGTRALNYSDGVLNTTRRQTEAVVRSAVQHASNAARDELFKANRDMIKGVQWVATLDSRTCLECSPLDGQFFPVEKHPHAPLHVGCRCTLIMVLKSWKELGLNGQDLPPSTRASMNGQVAGSINYNDWLKTQPNDVIVDALGVKKAKLFSDGDLNLKSFVSDNRSILTLKQLEARESGAFKAAGL